MKDLNIKKIQPTAGYVLVEPAKAQEKTVSGIILPENEGEKPQYGVVLAVGDDCDCSCSCECEDKKSTAQSCSCEAPVKIGDKVIYKKWGGNEFKIDDVEYQFLKFEDILAVIK
jgi:chaperonin GroES